mgnify:CR=1 FL=1
MYQCIDVFTHNFYYMGSRGNGGEGGRFVFHNASQKISDSSATLVEVEGDHAIIVIRIDIKNEDDYDRVRAIQETISIVEAPEQTRVYPEYDAEKAVSPEFVEYVRIDSNHDFGKYLEDDLDVGYSPRLKPGVTWLGKTKAGVTRTIDSTIEAFQTDTPAHDP